MKLLQRFRSKILMVGMLGLSMSASANVPIRANALALCEIAGAAYGSQKQFVASLASRMVEKAGLSAADPQCGPIWREAYQIGLKSSQGKIGSQADMDLILRLQAFEAEVLDSIIKQVSHRYPTEDDMASLEFTEWHLSPAGWVRGTTKRDGGILNGEIGQKGR